MKFNDFSFAAAATPTPAVTGPTAADMLLQQAIIHGSGTATVLQADTPMTGNAQAAILAKIRGVALPPDGSFVKGATIGPFYYKNGRKQTIDTPSAVPPSACYVLPDDVVNGIAPDLVNTYVWSSVGYATCLTLPSNAWFRSYITSNLTLPSKGPDGCAILWTADLTSTWTQVLNTAIANSKPPSTPPSSGGSGGGSPPPPPPPPIKKGPGYIDGYFGSGEDDPSAAVLANGGMIDSSTGKVNYIVRSGDSLSAIALKLGYCTKGAGNTAADWQQCVESAQEIADANGLSDPNDIAVGQLLNIPMIIVADPVTGEAVAVVTPPSSGLKWLLGAGALVMGILLFKGGESHGRRSR